MILYGQNISTKMYNYLSLYHGRFICPVLMLLSKYFEKSSTTLQQGFQVMQIYIASEDSHRIYSIKTKKKKQKRKTERKNSLSVLAMNFVELLLLMVRASYSFSHNLSYTFRPKYF